jgi:hypothetical protein
VSFSTRLVINMLFESTLILFLFKKTEIKKKVDSAFSTITYWHKPPIQPMIQ